MSCHPPTTSKSMDVEHPTLEDLKQIASKYHLDISDEDMVVYKEYATKCLESIYSEVNKVDDCTPPVKYRFTSRAPTVAENPYNAWVRFTYKVGSGVGKLAGRSVAIKDNISLAGVPMTIGSEFMQGYIPQYSATIVDRILDEGGMIKGQGTCEDMCSSGRSFTSITGPVLNPHDTSRDAGGSSSGCAVLVAAGAVDMAIGTDQGGSIRLPSSWCGVVGLKPTFGLVPYTGIPSLSGPMDYVGPMARTVKDCALLLEVIAGPDGLDPRQPTHIKPKSYTSELNESLRLDGLRVGILKEGFDNTEQDVVDLVKSAACALRELGAVVTEVSSDLHMRAQRCAIPIIGEGNYGTYTNYGIDMQSKGFKDTNFHDFVQEASSTRANMLPWGLKGSILVNGYIKERYGCHFYSKASNAMRVIVAEYDELFKQYDVIVMPTVKFKAPELPTEGKVELKDFLKIHLNGTTNTLPYNATGHPALSLNVGFSQGLPIGMMIVGRHWEDEVVLRVAHAVELQAAKNNRSDMETVEISGEK